MCCVQHPIMRHLTHPPTGMCIQMFLGYTKQATGALPAAADYTAYFNNGSSSFAPSGTLSDLIAQVNTDRFTILKSWTHKVGFADNQNSGVNVGWQGYANNDYKMNVVKRINLNKMYPKVMKFDDASQSVQGRGLFMWYQAVASNGLALAANVRPVAIDFWVKLEYEDA